MEDIGRLASRVTAALGCLSALANRHGGLFKDIIESRGRLDSGLLLHHVRYGLPRGERLAANAGQYLVNSIRSEYRLPATFVSHAIGWAGGASGGLYSR
jgi:hypothetical protein